MRVPWTARKTDQSILIGINCEYSLEGLMLKLKLQYSWASLVAWLVNNTPAMWETWVQSLGWKDPLEEGMATHASILAWRIPWTEEPGGLQSMGVTESSTQLIN